jgi:hypothetical protein
MHPPSLPLRQGYGGQVKLRRAGGRSLRAGVKFSHSTRLQARYRERLGKFREGYKLFLRIFYSAEAFCAEGGTWVVADFLIAQELSILGTESLWNRPLCEIVIHLR